MRSNGLSLACPTLAFFMLAVSGCGQASDQNAASARSDADTVLGDGGDAVAPEASADAPDDAGDAASACHQLENSAPLVQATSVDGPFPTGVGQGGAFSSGTYFLTQVTYYSGADAALGVPTPLDVWWRTTIDLDVTLGILATRTWYTAKGDPANGQEHREILLLDDLTSNTVHLQSQCSDKPVDVTAEYTATDSEFHLWITGVREDVYTKQP